MRIERLITEKSSAHNLYRKKGGRKKETIEGSLAEDILPKFQLLV